MVERNYMSTVFEKVHVRFEYAVGSSKYFVTVFKFADATSRGEIVFKRIQQAVISKNLSSHYVSMN